MSVTRLGVSLLNVVATIEKPASHHGTARPETKNSDVLLLARRPKKSDGAKHTTSVIAMTIQSRATRCMGKDSRTRRDTKDTTMEMREAILGARGGAMKPPT